MPRSASARDTRPQAPFITQLLAAAPHPNTGNAPRDVATSTYRGVETSDIKRMPSGYRKSLSA